MFYFFAFRFYFCYPDNHNENQQVVAPSDIDHVQGDSVKGAATHAHWLFQDRTLHGN
jgi:hypothetical protein